MKDCNPSLTPTEVQPSFKGIEGSEVDATHFRSLIGSLSYLKQMWPDLVYNIELLSQHMQKPTLSYMQGAKKILNYIKRIQNFGHVQVRLGSC